MTNDTQQVPASAAIADFPGSLLFTGACSMAPPIALKEIGRPFKTSLVVSRGETEGRIPAMLDLTGNCGGAPNLLTEVPASMVYLATRFPGAQLLPKTAALVARCLEWMNWLSNNVHAMSYGQMWRAQRFRDASEDLEGIRQKGRRNLVEQHTYVERILSDGRSWAVPGGYSIVDPYLLVFHRWGERVGFDMRRDCPAWTAIMDRVFARQAVQRMLKKEPSIRL